MLALTPTAIEVVRTIMAADGVPDGSGLRFSASGVDHPGELQMTIAPAPEQDDQVLVGEGAHVFLDPQAAEFLDDKILDAEVDEQGQLSFALGEQAAPPVSN
ncbi:MULTISPECIES: iron-sulfur cluster biosynthesis protein [unclassified Crossiella]|uniref:iron-sulfur cluster biosynthesis protein n=1 Tax=unclassified Crossiella TaxID=2620835 RepID=UPI00207CF0C2|nr:MULTISPECIES: iron-sulfur cluster biosynthesis protein [unclassified Crossiella]MCO1578670.1 iron-sulfur cluster biosynthesis protein [Crossiella sp. SN42]WHT17130.1 iron-sulfur cluster biosynthesis protein [Crossiella sp. CA-258035]